MHLLFDAVHSLQEILHLLSNYLYLLLGCMESLLQRRVLLIHSDRLVESQDIDFYASKPEAPALFTEPQAGLKDCLSVCVCVKLRRS